MHGRPVHWIGLESQSMASLCIGLDWNLIAWPTCAFDWIDSQCTAFGYALALQSIYLCGIPNSNHASCAPWVKCQPDGQRSRPAGLWAMRPAGRPMEQACSSRWPNVRAGAAARCRAGVLAAHEHTARPPASERLARSLQYPPSVRVSYRPRGESGSWARAPGSRTLSRTSCS